MNSEVLLFIFLFTWNYAVPNENGYIINVPNRCKLPNFNAYDKEVEGIFKSQPYKSCTSKGLLTFTTVKNNIATIHLNQTALSDYYDDSEIPNCCFKYVFRNGSEYLPDVGISFSNCTKFQSEAALKNNTVLARCYKNSGIVYENVHNPIVISEEIKNKTTQNNNKTKPISVLFIVIDSVSRLNLIRTMPKTRNFLLQNGFIEMKGYNKIDDNTFPNFNALLTGFNLKQSFDNCDPTKIGMLDNCSMIWYDYRKLGYITAYAEDWASISTYNYFKKGFTKPPTDYYFKPYFEASETLPIIYQDSMPYCTGPESAGERILNLAKDFSVTFLNEPSFGIFWMNTFSHNYINTPSGMDGKFLNFFSKLKTDGVLNEKVVIFLSDHGIRYGNIRLTNIGWFEERLPMNLISLPPWFKTKFPQETFNLRSNSKKLTSTYDLYKTLQHFLILSGKDYNETKCMGNELCQSMLSSISKNRSCENAGVPSIWCTCYGNLSPINLTSNLVMSTSNAIVSHVGAILISIQKAVISETFDDHNYLIVTVLTQPFNYYMGLFKVAIDSFELIRVIKLY